MANFTISSLRANIDYINTLLKESDSIYYYKLSSRNGYNAVDLCKTLDDKNITVSNLDCNEPARILSERVDDDYEYYLGKKE